MGTMPDEVKREKGAKTPILGRAAPYLVSVLALAMLVAHAAKWKAVRIDGITLGLLGILLVASRWDLIRKLKFGDFEAEIAPAEVAKAQAAVSDEVGPADVVANSDQFQDVLQMIRTDPTLGLARVRIELERKLRALRRLVSPPSMRSGGAGQLVRELVVAEVLPHPLARSLTEVLGLANRAIHGETIRRDDAEVLGALGVRLIAELQELYEDKATEPIQVEEIDPAEVARLQESRFRVVTIVPRLDHPVRNTRIVDQDALDELLDGYSEYAEFIVSVEPLPDGSVS